MSYGRCAMCDRKFDDNEVEKVWGGNICLACAIEMDEADDE